MRLSFQKIIYRAIRCVSLVSLPSAFAGGGAPVPVQNLVNKSDAVVIAQILDGTKTTQGVTLTLDVRETLKGALQAGRALSVDCRFSTDATILNSDVKKDRGMFFLRNAGERWSVVPVTSGFVPDARGTYFVLPSNAVPTSFGKGLQLPVYERVIAEVAGSVENGVGQLGGGVDFGYEYRSNASPMMKTIFTQFAASTNRGLRVAGLRASVTDGNSQALAQIAQGAGLQALDNASLAEEIKSYVTVADPQAVGQLGKLATSQASSPELRAATVTALARIHTKESLPFLARFLDDPDIQLRSLAAGGMAMFANNVPVGGHEPAAGGWVYRTEDTLRYSVMDPAVLQNNPSISVFWKSWWAAHGAELQ